jgi:hypothetical protein
MKSISKLIALAFITLVMAISAQATTLIVYVNTNTWDVTSYGGDGTYNVDAYQATYYDYYNNPHYRYFIAGLFDTVVIESNVSPYPTLQTLTSCNNIFYIDRSAQTAYYCSNGYNGSGNGVNGEVKCAAGFQTGDLYVGGSFSSAGGYSSTSYFSCYRWSDGWSGVNGVRTDGAVSGFSYNNYRLVVAGSFSYVYGPTSSGGGYTSLWSPNSAYWNEWHYAFPSDYWSAP